MTTTELDNRGLAGVVLGALVGLSLAVAGFIAGVGASGLAGETTSFWYLSRAAGLVAYALLWGSVVWGLLLSSKIGQAALRPPLTLDAHQFLSNVAIGFAAFHGLVLMGDRYLSFPLQAVLVPFAGSYKPVLVAAGQIGLWLSLLLSISFVLRRRIGQRRWRQLHMLGFVAYWAALLHSVLIGSDSHAPWLQAFYLATAGGVLFLTFYRILAFRQRATA
ncbi:MAG: ferric reductase-like protein [Anaerolinea sp.]|nr:ferric reductase-like protein [Anaerolinea sp.]